MKERQTETNNWLRIPTLMRLGLLISGTVTKTLDHLGHSMYIKNDQSGHRVIYTDQERSGLHLYKVLFFGTKETGTHY